MASTGHVCECIDGSAHLYVVAASSVFFLLGGVLFCVGCLCLLQVPIRLCPHLGPVAVGSLSLFLVTQPQECRERGALRSVDWCTVCVHCMCVYRGGFHSVCERKILSYLFSNCVVSV